MMTHRIGVLLVVLSVPACGGGAPAKARAPDAATAPVAASAPVAQASFASTNELVSRPEVRALVDELAAAPRIAEKHVSYDGHASEEFKVYERLATIATDTEMVALLGHTSPIVRGYAAQGVIERDLAGAPLDGVLADETLVSTQRGCFGSTEAVWHVTVQSLCNSRAKSLASRTLRELARPGQGKRGEMASRCMATP